MAATCESSQLLENDIQKLIKPSLKDSYVMCSSTEESYVWALEKKKASLKVIFLFRDFIKVKKSSKNFVIVIINNINI